MFGLLEVPRGFGAVRGIVSVPRGVTRPLASPRGFRGHPGRLSARARHRKPGSLPARGPAGIMGRIEARRTAARGCADTLRLSPFRRCDVRSSRAVKEKPHMTDTQPDQPGQRGSLVDAATNRKAHIGVIGAGWWAVVNHIPVLKVLADCEIVAVNRLGAGRARRGAGRPSASTAASRTIARCSTRCRWTASSSPRRTRSISSMPRRHLPKGCHVLVEKPLTTSAADARALVALAGKGRARDRRRLWLEFQAVDGRGAAPGARASAGSSMSSCRWRMRSRTSSPASR